HRVGEVLGTIPTHVVLDDRYLRACLRHDQVARVDGGVRGGCHEENVNWFLERGAALEVHVGTIAHEGGVEAAEDGLMPGLREVWLPGPGGNPGGGARRG